MELTSIVLALVFIVAVGLGLLLLGSRWAALNRVDPVNRLIADSLRLCAEENMTQDELVESLRTLFTMHDISLGRQSVARRLIFASTVVDQQLVSQQIKQRARALAMSLPNRF